MRLPRTLDHPAPVVLAAGAVVAQVFYPLVYDAARNRLTVLSVALFAAAALTHAAVTRGRAAAVALLLVAGGGGLLAEIVGLATGVPFGRYTYGPGLGPTLLGTPLLIGAAWLMMAWPCWLLGVRLAAGHRFERARRIAAAAWTLAAWDLFLDPQMVGEGYWRWAHPEPGLPGVYGVPLTNHVGWLLVAVLMFTVLDRVPAVHRRAEPEHDTVMFALLGWVYLSSVLALSLFFGLPYAALWGAAGMGLTLAPVALGHAPARPAPRSPAPPPP